MKLFNKFITTIRLSLDSVSETFNQYFASVYQVSVHRIASTPFALAISSLDSVSSSPSIPGSNRRNCEGSGLHFLPGPLLVSTPSL